MLERGFFLYFQRNLAAQESEQHFCCLWSLLVINFLLQIGQILLIFVRFSEFLAFSFAMDLHFFEQYFFDGCA